jgi:hypothetical protein
MRCATAKDMSGPEQAQRASLSSPSEHDSSFALLRQTANQKTGNASPLANAN